MAVGSALVRQYINPADNRAPNEHWAPSVPPTGALLDLLASGQRLVRERAPHVKLSSNLQARGAIGAVASVRDAATASGDDSELTWIRPA